jgi:DNA-binding LacI/PurR family transcriptional regulator
MKITTPTSRDIAELAGVSQATVSRALRNSPLVRPETRERVQQIARELNYFVNRNAAGLRTHQSNTIALLIFDDSKTVTSQLNLFFLSMLDNIMRSAARLGYDILVSLQQLNDDWHIQYCASQRADGLILLGYGDYVDYREKLDALAEADTHFIIWGPIDRDQPGHSIACDNESGGRQAAQHLLRLGRKRIAFLGSRSSSSPEFAARFQGYADTLADAGIAPDAGLQVNADNSEIQGYKAVRKLLEQGATFDALFAVTDLVAIGAMRALKEAGVRVPADVSVVGFDDMPLAAYVTPALSTVRQNVATAPDALVRAIVGLIEGQPAESTLITPELVVRDSCGGSDPAVAEGVAPAPGR